VAIALDTEHSAEQSLKVAKVIADNNTCTTVLHVKEAMPSYIVNYAPENYQASMEDEFMSKLNSLASRFDNGVGVLIEGHSGRSGRSGRSILAWADAHDVDCIIIASHRLGLQDYLLGSTAARSCPPYTVHVTR
jgi:universal stress protein F